MDKEELDILNKVLTGEQMAVDIIQTYNKDLDDEELRKQMVTWINSHKDNSQKISTYILKNGEKPKERLGIAGFMAETTAKINTLVNSEPIDILREIYDGEDKGIERSVQLSKGNLSEEATEIIEDVLSIDHTHLKELKELISKYENMQ